MQIPIDKLAPETLNRVIEEFICRSGTDYGVKEYSLEEKVAQVKAQLQSGKAILTWDEDSGSCNISAES